MENPAAVEVIATTPNKGQFWITIVSVVCSGAISLVVFGVYFGGMNTRLSAVEEKTKQQETEYKELNNKLTDIQIKMVNKDDWKELRKDFLEASKK